LGDNNQQQIGEVVSRSYGQCCTSPSFFDDFYKNFFSLSAEISRQFRHTDLSKQKELLRSGLGHVIMSFKGNTMSNLKMGKIGKSHSKNELNIKPELYPLWRKALLKTIENHDPEYCDKIRRAWVTVIHAGINQLVNAY